MKLCRFAQSTGSPRIGLVVEDHSLIDLTAAGISSLTELIARENALEDIARLASQPLPNSRSIPSACSRRSNARKSGPQA